MVTKNGVKVDLKKLTQLYSESAVNKAALDWFADRQYNSAETTVERLQAKLRSLGQPPSRREIIDLFRGLEDAGCGEFIAGRHGHQSRFSWSTGLVSVGQAAAGEDMSVEPIAQVEVREDDANAVGSGRLEHVFNLRADAPVTFALPADLTKTEANRLADFIRTLPFES